MERIKPFNAISFEAGRRKDTELIGVIASQISLQVDGVLAGSAANPPTDQPSRAMGVPEVVQDEQPLIRMAGGSWGHLSALQRGGYDRRQTGTGTQDIAAEHTLDLSKFLAAGMIDARVAKVFVRTTFPELTQLAQTAPSGLTAEFRPSLLAVERNLTGGYFRPRIEQFEQDLSSASASIERKVTFESDRVVFGVLLEAIDASLLGGIADFTDGLIRTLRVDFNQGAMVQQENIRATWRQLRHLSASRAGYSDADWSSSVGVAFLPFKDTGRTFGGGTAFRKGDSFTVTFDTSTTVERGLGGATTPATGDRVRCTVVAFEQVAPTAARTGSSNGAVRSGVTGRPERQARKFLGR